MDFVTDTHALLWWFVDSPKISPKASAIFEECENGENVIFVPSIVIAEALSIFDKKRVSFNFRRLLKKIDESDNFTLVALDFPILQKMTTLKNIPELHDKIIVATVLLLKYASSRMMHSIFTLNSMTLPLFREDSSIVFHSKERLIASRPTHYIHKLKKPYC